MAAMAVIAPVLAAVSVGLLAVFSALRKLTLEQISQHLDGHRQDPRRAFPGCAASRDRLNHLVRRRSATGGSPSASIVIVGTVWFTVLAWVLLGAVLDRLRWIRAVDRLDVRPTDRAGRARCRRRCATSATATRVRAIDALAGVSLRIGVRASWSPCSATTARASRPWPGSWPAGRRPSGAVQPPGQRRAGPDRRARRW